MRTSSKPPAPPPADSDLYSLIEIAHKAKISLKTVRRLVARGELKTHRIGTQLRVSEHDWQAYLAGSRQP